MDQYQDSARHRVLCPGDSNRTCTSSHGKEYDEARLCRVKYLPCGPVPKTPFPYEIPVLKVCTSAGGEYGRFCNGTLGFYERAKEILATSYYHGVGTSWKSDCSDSRISSGSIHLYVVLKASRLSSRSIYGLSDGTVHCHSHNHWPLDLLEEIEDSAVQGSHFPNLTLV